MLQKTKDTFIIQDPDTSPVSEYWIYKCTTAAPASVAAKPDERYLQEIQEHEYKATPPVPVTAHVINVFAILDIATFDRLENYSTPQKPPQELLLG